AAVAALRPATLPAVHACACAMWALPREAGLGAYVFSWLENQVAAAIKGVPLGQAQRRRGSIRSRRSTPWSRRAMKPSSPVFSVPDLA
ncbi:urease accessory UreF family protein, partial [Bordetella pertussis]|uniref:urease accessory UreF family protein n=1 Tax=Bordetella pertussis TaxID=520 RepID=UPI000A4DC97F